MEVMRRIRPIKSRGFICVSLRLKIRLTSASGGVYHKAYGLSMILKALSRQSRNVPLAGKVEMSPFGRALRSACYVQLAGEAETGSAGEQPDRGVAGRNSSADDEKERDPPGAFFDLGSGPTSGRRYGPDPGVGFGFGFETPSDQK